MVELERAPGSVDDKSSAKFGCALGLNDWFTERLILEGKHSPDLRGPGEVSKAILEKHRELSERCNGTALLASAEGMVRDGETKMKDDRDHSKSVSGTPADSRAFETVREATP